MLRGVDDEYYEENLDMPTRVISTDNFQGRISLAALWVSRIAWGVGVLTLAGIVLFLVFLKDFGGFKLSVSPPIGLIRVGDEKQNPPATFFWKSEGDHMITVTSKDYVTHHLMLDVEGRVMADLSPFPLTHFRSGRLRPLPDGSRGNPEVDPEDAREFPIQAREAILEQAAPEEGEEQHEAETEEASPAAGDGASFEQPMVPSEGATPQSVDPGGAAMETVSQVSAPTPPAGKQLGASPDRPQLLPNSEPRAGPEREPPQDGASPASPLPNPGRQATESRSEFPAEHAGHSERLSSAQAAAAEEGEDATASDPASELDLTALWEGFSAVGPARPLELVEPQAQPRPQPRAAETPSGTAATTNWQPSGQYRVLRRNRGVGLAVPRGSHPISIYGVEDGLVIEIEEQFLKQLRGLRDFHLARKAQSAPTPPEEESAPAPAP
jgi:hypothetical protein